MQMDMVGPSIGQAVNQPGVSVKGKDNRFISGEDHVKILVAEAVGMLAPGLERHEIHDVDDKAFPKEQRSHRGKA
jgi:hypothetical protein